MTSATLNARERAVHVVWSDGEDARFPFIWLRDNCPSGFHPQTQERTFDLTSVRADIAPKEVRAGNGAVEITWPDGHRSLFDAGWLHDHRPGVRMPDPADIPPLAWRRELGASGIPRAGADDVMASDDALLDWLVRTRIYGLSIVEGIADSVAAGMAIARRIGFLRETNFGVDFQVVSKPDPNNLAYTAHRLPLHTDLTNQELPPGFQFLHCLANEATGGGSLFCDGFAIAEDIRAQDADAFDLLSTVSVPFRFHDADTDIRCRRCVLELDEAGNVAGINFNAHLADIFDLPADLMERYYRAYRLFMVMSRDDAYLVTLKLKGGEMVVFDNRRVLHGRDAFDPATGFRHLNGCYVDRGDFDSCIRVLSRARGMAAQAAE
ncbi:MAG: TauD/TfdA family dioxygenase [Rhodobiaceae bacterium]|nr:TauD/TfdA family dioxygenase [Rhodobiaceae bacterium]MCC0012083.1 TauD/TfdA family dioxygenase [Rhodobiaceae bacterium]MCC0019352.1 TauD/TfdA family dioxygenase [Rhodobiaceae bacterium]MCC0061001.1 TauD/TfdA family dioxygenase [Rhodobiaceae bacterium]